MSKPTIVCVPGAWHTPEIYAKVLEILSSYGYPTVGLPLPSAGAMPPHANFDEDVKGIRDCLTELVEKGKDVVLVMHSYTGAEAPAGLGKKERQAANLKGGVIRLVFIMAFAMSEGFAPTAGGAQYPMWRYCGGGLVLVERPEIPSSGCVYHRELHSALNKRRSVCVPVDFIVSEESGEYLFATKMPIRGLELSSGLFSHDSSNTPDSAVEG
ncbi:hypothetical protein P171DRAFT_430271 [Karstenula rhodostoma CBS 690.94]|uniref:AB hydrolase-1 domain-containing protein n=1 Tax=Karstenula rhodostoma CBS 690.94 TaxID=1392251 RepID=A0A9P4PJ50_9PLEO|nr:hypothetical protein P171DRAFT_430271 [Karstenula rhodostoma CBS 690.94]